MQTSASPTLLEKILSSKIILRGFYLVSFIACMIILAIAIPPFIDSIQRVPSDIAAHLNALQITTGTYSLLLISREFITIVAMMVTSFVMFRLGYNRPTIILYATAIMLNSVARTELDDIVIEGGNATGFVFALFGGVDALSTFLAYYVVATFPDGQVSARWLRWMFIALAIWFPFWLFPATNPDSFPVIYERLAYLAILVSSLIWQRYRYFNEFTPEKRQQTKLVLFVIGLITIINTVNNLVPEVLFSVLDEGTTFQFVFELIARTIYQLSFIALFVAFLLAIRRYRLWDLDFAIHRTLSYLLTAVVSITIFIVSGWLVYRGANYMLDNIPAVIFGLTVGAVIAGGFLHIIWRRVNRFVDKRIYKIVIDYKRDPQYLVDLSEEPLAIFGAYAGLEVVGNGGMGYVYRARHTENKNEFAIKILADNLLEDETARHQFEHEAKVTKELDHPNIIRLYEWAFEQNIPYMVMEFVDGKDFEAFLQENKSLTLEQLKPIVVPIAQALDYVHEQQIVHRDIKPANLMIESRQKRVILMDFGLARDITTSDIFQAEMVVGTLDYMSPEQIQVTDDLDHRADIYSLGVTVYQFLTGKRPFEKDSHLATIMAHLYEPAPNPHEIVPHLPLSACLALEKALAKDAEDRFSSCMAFVEAVFEGVES